ncbi:MAG: DUF3147 family protein [Nevskiales bacterium]
MTYYAVKLLLSAVVIVLISELAKRNTLAGALLASLPLTSLLAFIWVYWETRDAARIATLSLDIFWLVFPSLALFLVLPWLLQRGTNFWLALPLACAVTAMCYLGMLQMLKLRG